MREWRVIFDGSGSYTLRVTGLDGTVRTYFGDEILPAAARWGIERRVASIVWPIETAAASELPARDLWARLREDEQ